MSLELIPGTMNFTLGNGLAIFKGSTWQVPVTVCCIEDDKIVAANLEGFTGRCQIKISAEDPTVVATPKVDIEDPIEGIFTINLTDEETLLIGTEGDTFRDTKTYQYDVYFDHTDGRAYRVLQGFVEVSPNITEV